MFGDAVLTTPAERVVDFDAELRRLVTDLEDTMVDAPGIGLAANQIGVPLRVFTYHVEDCSGHLVNPEVVHRSPEQEVADEGCLSLPPLYFPTPRAEGLLVRGSTMHGEPVTVEARGKLARCLQHEIDHLDGILFIDRLDPAQREAALQAVEDAMSAGRPAPDVRESPHVTGGIGL